MIPNKLSHALMQVAAFTFLHTTGSVLAQDKPGSAATAQAPMASSSMVKADQALLKEMAQVNVAEINAAKLALSKSQDAKVKAYAQKMIDDHTTALQDLQAIAQKKGVTLPSEPDRAHQAKARAMEKLSASAFDRSYVAEGGVRDHTKAHKLMKRVEAKARDAELKAAAAKMDPVVNEHLASAKQMQGDRKAGSTASGSSVGGKTDFSAEPAIIVPSP